MTTITTSHFDRIVAAKTWQDAAAICGGHHEKLDFIRRVLGPRSTGGFFNPTVKNVRAKFAQAWAKAQEGR